jgi:hypothetical protein
MLEWRNDGRDIAKRKEQRMETLEHRNFGFVIVAAVIDKQLLINAK